MLQRRALWRHSVDCPGKRGLVVDLDAASMGEKPPLDLRSRRATVSEYLRGVAPQADAVS
jgi:hypothetical protein